MSGNRNEENGKEDEQKRWKCQGWNSRSGDRGDKRGFMMARWTGKWMQVLLDERERERTVWGGFL